VPRAVEALGTLARRHRNFHDRAILRVSRGSPSLSLFRQWGWHTSYELSNDDVGDAQARGEGELRSLARTIAEEVTEQNTDAISFDVSMYSFVNKYVAPLIKPDILYHGQAPGMLPWLQQVVGESGSHEWSRDARLVTLEVPVLSDIEQRWACTGCP